MVDEKVGETRHQESRRESLGHGDTHRSGQRRRRACSAVLQRRQGPLGALGVPDHRQSRIGQRIAVAAAQEQCHAESPLQFFDMPRHGGRRHGEPFPGRDEAAATGHRQEDANVVPLHSTLQILMVILSFCAFIKQ
jgi:hypothetical protein